MIARKFTSQLLRTTILSSLLIFSVQHAHAVSYSASMTINSNNALGAIAYTRVTTFQEMLQFAMIYQTSRLCGPSGSCEFHDTSRPIFSLCIPYGGLCCVPPSLPGYPPTNCVALPVQIYIAVFGDCVAPGPWEYVTEHHWVTILGQDSWVQTSPSRRATLADCAA
jgi:hypothetical protein